MDWYSLFSERGLSAEGLEVVLLRAFARAEAERVRCDSDGVCRQNHHQYSLFSSTLGFLLTDNKIRLKLNPSTWNKMPIRGAEDHRLGTGRAQHPNKSHYQQRGGGWK